jgi:hypothetical protein
VIAQLETNPESRHSGGALCHPNFTVEANGFLRPESRMAPCALALVALGLADRLRGATMRPREASPFWVWLTIGLMAFGSAAYVTSYFMIEDFMAVFKQ